MEHLIYDGPERARKACRERRGRRSAVCRRQMMGQAQYKKPTQQIRHLASGMTCDQAGLTAAMLVFTRSRLLYWKRESLKETTQRELVSCSIVASQFSFDAVRGLLLVRDKLRQICYSAVIHLHEAKPKKACGGCSFDT
jgi:hypothetical protein